MKIWQGNKGQYNQRKSGRENKKKKKKEQDKLHCKYKRNNKLK